MTIKRRRTFTPEFKLEAAQLVVQQNYSVREAADAMSVGKSTMGKWVHQFLQHGSALLICFWPDKVRNRTLLCRP